MPDIKPIKIIFVRQDNLCLWQRPGDVWVGTSCYEMIKQLFGELAHGEAVEVSMLPVGMKRLGKKKIQINLGKMDEQS